MSKKRTIITVPADQAKLVETLERIMREHYVPAITDEVTKNLRGEPVVLPPPTHPFLEVLARAAAGDRPVGVALASRVHVHGKPVSIDFHTGIVTIEQTQTTFDGAPTTQRWTFDARTALLITEDGV